MAIPTYYDTRTNGASGGGLQPPSSVQTGPVGQLVSGGYNVASNVANKRAQNMQARSNWFNQQGLTNLGGMAGNNATRATQRAGNLGQVADWWSTWSPGKFVTEGGAGAYFPPASQQPQGPGQGTTTGNMPYTDYTQGTWDQITGINPNTNVTGGLTPFSDQSALGGYYGGYEQGALSNLQRIAGLGLDQYGQNVLGLREAINMQDRMNMTPQQAALEQRNMSAIEGGLTPQSQQQYNMLMEPYRLEQDRIREDTINKLGANYSLWGNARLEAENELARDMSAQGGSLMAQLMQQDYQTAVSTLMQDKELQNAALQIAAGMGATNQEGQLMANQQILNQTQQMGQLMMQQINAQMEEAQANIQNQFRQADQMGNMSQWMNEYDLRQREVNSGVINDFLSTLFAGLGGYAKYGLQSAGY